MKKSYDSKFKSRVALEALRGDLTVAEIAGKYQIHPNLVQQWKKTLQESASDVFMTKAERKAENKPYTEPLFLKPQQTVTIPKSIVAKKQHIVKINITGQYEFILLWQQIPKSIWRYPQIAIHFPISHRAMTFRFFAYFLF